MENIYELLERMKPRPHLYLGRKEISLLRAYLDGYNIAQDDYSINSFEMPPFYLFHFWTADKLGTCDKLGWGKSAGWSTIILQENDGDETKALEHFFSYWKNLKK